MISKISQVEIAKSSEPQVRIFYVNKTTQNNHYIKMDLGIKGIVFIFTKTLLPPSIFGRMGALQKGFQPILYLSIIEVHTFLLHFLGISYTKVRICAT